MDRGKVDHGPPQFLNPLIPNVKYGKNRNFDGPKQSVCLGLLIGSAQTLSPRDSHSQSRCSPHIYLSGSNLFDITRANQPFLAPFFPGDSIFGLDQNIQFWL